MVEKNAAALERESDELVERIRPILAGHSPEVQGATIGQLLALFIAGLAPELRKELRDHTIAVADELVPVFIGELIRQGRAGPEWRG